MKIKDLQILLSRAALDVGDDANVFFWFSGDLPKPQGGMQELNLKNYSPDYPIWEITDARNHPKCEIGLQILSRPFGGV